MNLAFQALAIFALALPGIILKNSYRNGFFWDRPRQQSPIAEEVAYSLLLACALHAVYAPIVSRWWPIELNAVAILLVGQYGKDSALLDGTVQALTAHPGRILTYFVILYAASAGLGITAHLLVRKLELDLKSRFFRFNHQWHYLLHGEIANFLESNVEVADFDFVSVACVVDTNAGSFLYVGVLDAFYFNRSGDLDLLVLTGAMRRPIDSSKEDASGAKPEYFFINAEYLYLKYNDVKNVSIRYVLLPPEDPTESSHTEPIA